jgi:hypothetical protein
MAHYDVIDFVAVLIGYAVSGEPTLLAFYERLSPFAEPFMALDAAQSVTPSLDAFPFSRYPRSAPAWKLCVRSAQRDLLARNPLPSPGGLFDRTEKQWIVVDVDGTRQVARQRALPQTEALPAPHRRFDQVCAPGYQGRKRGEVVRTRTVVLQSHTHQFLSTFGGPGNGDYRGELRRAIAVITSYAARLGLSPTSILVQLDGHDARRCTSRFLCSRLMRAVIARSRAYHEARIWISSSRHLLTLQIG